MEVMKPNTRLLTISVQSDNPPVEIGYSDYSSCSRSATGKWRHILENYGSDEVRMVLSPGKLGPSSFHRVLCESNTDGTPFWHHLKVVVTLDGKTVFCHRVSPADSHGIVFEPTDSPLHMDFDNGTDEWLVAAFRWRGFEWRPKSLDVPADFQFDPAKLVIPYFHFPIDYDGAEQTVLVRDDAIRYDGRATAMCAASPEYEIYAKFTGASFLVLTRNGLRPCPKLMSGGDWALLLSNSPQFADQCDWAKMSHHAWARLLCDQPQFAERCDQWSAFNGENWADILSRQPQFVDKCDWSKMTGSDWANLLRKLPRFADRCHAWHLFGSRDWSSLLSEQPQFADKCDWGKIDGYDWKDLLIKQPQFADKGDWAKLSDWMWPSLLLRQPQFAGKFDWTTLNGRFLAMLLSRQPQFADKCDWTKLDDDDWELLLLTHPEVDPDWPLTRADKERIAQIKKRMGLSRGEEKGTNSSKPCRPRMSSSMAPRPVSSAALAKNGETRDGEARDTLANNGEARDGEGRDSEGLR